VNPLNPVYISPWSTSHVVGTATGVPSTAVAAVGTAATACARSVSGREVCSTRSLPACADQCHDRSEPLSNSGRVCASHGRHWHSALALSLTVIP
jgi:hypothetical protein